DLASPGRFTFDLASGEAGLLFRAETAGASSGGTATLELAALRAAELERRAALEPRARAAEAHLARRGARHSLIAGYPWFTDWGRDTFIALRGLLLARGEAERAASILLAWSEHVSEGMLPNRFPDGVRPGARAEAPEYNSVDASLWFVVAVEETLAAARSLSRAQRGVLQDAARAILAGYADGTRHGIRAEHDGLLACGEPGTQLRWMDAKAGDEVMTPRVGKPVEVQALWLRALAFGARFERRFRALGEHAQLAFERFWNPATGALFDVLDADHVPGTNDASLRPNQILAVGGLGRSWLAPAPPEGVGAVGEGQLRAP